MTMHGHMIWPCMAKNGRAVHDERFVDGLGRERFFRGVNVVFKDPPFLPHTHAFHANLSFAEADVDLLSSLGVNLIRLGVMWPGVVPRIRGQVDREYLARVRAIVAMCRARNPPIYVWVHPEFSCDVSRYAVMPCESVYYPSCYEPTIAV